jgi:hypothetical protein
LLAAPTDAGKTVIASEFLPYVWEMPPRAGDEPFAQIFSLGTTYRVLLDGDLVILMAISLS